VFGDRKEITTKRIAVLKSLWMAELSETDLNFVRGAERKYLTSMEQKMTMFFKTLLFAPVMLIILMGWLLGIAAEIMRKIAEKIVKLTGIYWDWGK
jgi:hypothetical protein